MRKLGSLAGVLRAPVETLQQLEQVGPAAIADTTCVSFKSLGHF
jgi:DNA repair protein RadC